MAPATLVGVKRSVSIRRSSVAHSCETVHGNPIPTTGIGGQLQNFASLLYGFFGVQSQSQFFNKDQARVDQDYRGYRVRESGIYFQDTWRVRPNFTLNYGIRWDYNAVPYEVNGQMSTLVDQDPSGPQPPADSNLSW